MEALSSKNFSADELVAIANAFGIYKVYKKSIEITKKDNRQRTVCYRLFKYADGFRWRRVAYNMFYPKYPYQLNRNTATGEWHAFSNIENAIGYINNYINSCAA